MGSLQFPNMGMGLRLAAEGRRSSAIINARTSRKKIADILSTEIKNIKERYPHFELEIEKNATCTPQEHIKLIDCIVHLFPVYVWFSGKGAFIRQEAFVREGRLIQTCQLRGALIK